MADSIQGDGLLQAHRALAAPVEDPEQLDRARRRFSEPLPSRSPWSHNSTLSQRPNPPSEEQQHREEQQRREERKWQLIREHAASCPSRQFAAQRDVEYRKLFKPDPEGSGPVADLRLFERAREIVKNHWIEQGIWNEKWTYDLGRWKHEEPLEPEPGSESEAEVKSLFCPPSARAEAKTRRPKSIEELRRIAERQAVRVREREASRPFYQFIHQLSKERDQVRDEVNPPWWPDMSDPDPRKLHRAIYRPYLQTAAAGESSTRGATISSPPDINTTAYERVKNTWMKRGIWDRKWGILPGMSWKHEQPQEEMLLERMGPVPTRRPEGDRHGTGKAPARNIFEFLVPILSNHEASGTLDPSQQELPAASVSHALGGDDDNGTPGTPPRRNLFLPPSPVESSHGPVSGGLNTSPQESHPPIDPVKLSNADPNHSSAASTSRRRHAEGRETPRSVPLQRLRRGKREPSIEGRQASQIARTALGPAHVSKVCKAGGKSGTPPDDGRTPPHYHLRLNSLHTG